MILKLQIIFSTNIVFDFLNVIVCIVLSVKSVKKYHDLKLDKIRFKNQLTESEEKLFLHSIFALVCLLIRLFNDICLLMGFIFNIQLLLELIQIIIPVLASIHGLGSSVFLLIISKFARKSYFKFYRFEKLFPSCKILPQSFQQY